MIDTARSWVKDNATLLYFLIAQAIAGVALLISIISYVVNLEARVAILETRGSSHVSDINNRLTVTEKETESNNKRIAKIVEIMTRELHISPTRVAPENGR